MAHYAELNQNNEVIRVLYMDNEIITNENGEEDEQLGIAHLHFHHGSERKWVRTSYRGNFRGRYAGIGDLYREDIDKFITPNSPYPSWIINETNGEWESPISKPEHTEEYPIDQYYYDWDEDLYQQDNTKGWLLLPIEF